MSANATKWAWDQKAGGAKEKVVLLALADWASPHDGYTHELCWYSQKSIAARCECSPKTVERALSSLQEKKLIKCVPRFKSNKARTSDYIFLNIDGNLAFESIPPDNVTGGGGDNVTAPPRQCDGTPPDNVTEDSKNKNLKRNRNPPPTPKGGGGAKIPSQGKERRRTASAVDEPPEYHPKFLEVCRAFPERGLGSMPLAYTSWREMGLEHRHDEVMRGVRREAYLCEQQKDRRVRNLADWLREKRFILPPAPPRPQARRSAISYDATSRTLAREEDAPAVASLTDGILSRIANGR